MSKKSKKLIKALNQKSEKSLTFEKIYKKMEEVFENNLVNPEHYPNIFKYQYMVAKYLCEKNKC